MSRSVVALDTTVFYTSIARIISDDPQPKCGYRYAAPVTRDHDPASEVRRHTDLATQVVSAIVTSTFGVPDLVMMVRPQLGTMGDDPSAQRRIAVWWEIVRQLDAQKVPVGEVSLLSVQKACVGSGQWGKRGTDALEQWVGERFPEYTAPSFTDEKTGKTKADPRYRSTTVAAAAVAALVAGMPSPLAGNDHALHALRNGISLPDGVSLPAPSTTRSGKPRKKREDYITEKLADIETATLEELEGMNPRSHTLRAAIKKRLNRIEEKALMGGDW
ncbi:hypothetical protein [Mycobacteroides abscessus]|uniref:hypothetical protein n=1 Tax=Mycobacteroides abscessus TaxID=36809 RepID=UPI00092C74B4|nr:hypothetical protein [Mycobacteroides abscessus]SHP98341.1 Uncharacterised protein [Mycobacteroides abscessus subsp. abscessus]SHQ60960.1 Uncharacterised protein [Mycobacteroides abscessus subsp. abscessus]SKD63597.1 Uncharacterised protein [Mycobacteroides abscessus subsp. abscessus]SLD62972.1 Uncharacterised protein [Mycobacteroides abscessus subsp. abscessus]